MDDREKFEHLVRKSVNQAYRFAWYLSGNSSDANDLVQEAFLRAFQHRERFNETRPFMSWLARILHHLYIDMMKRAERRRAISFDGLMNSEEGAGELELPGSEKPVIDELIEKDTSRMLESVLSKLPRHYRRTLILADIEGRSLREIGKLTYTPVETVKTRIHRAHRLVRQSLEHLERKRRFVSKPSKKAAAAALHRLQQLTFDLEDPPE